MYAIKTIQNTKAAAYAATAHPICAARGESVAGRLKSGPFVCCRSSPITPLGIIGVEPRKEKNARKIFHAPSSLVGAETQVRFKFAREAELAVASDELLLQLALLGHRR